MYLFLLYVLFTRDFFESLYRNICISNALKKNDNSSRLAQNPPEIAQ